MADERLKFTQARGVVIPFPGKPIEIENVKLIGDPPSLREARKMRRDDPRVFAMDEDTMPAEYCPPNEDCA